MDNRLGKQISELITILNYSRVQEDIRALLRKNKDTVNMNEAGNISGYSTQGELT